MESGYSEPDRSSKAQKPVAETCDRIGDQNRFANGSPDRTDSPGRGRWHISARRGTAGIAEQCRRGFSLKKLAYSAGVCYILIVR